MLKQVQHDRQQHNDYMDRKWTIWVDKWTICLYHLSNMSNQQSLTISQYAKIKGISTKTVRRRIKAGELAYEMSKGKYLIKDMPDRLKKKVDKNNDMSMDMSTSVNKVDKNNDMSMDMSTLVKDLLGQIQRLTEENRNLAITLGRYQAKIESLETKLITASKPWWRRIFSRGGI
jgi:gas vesicle protein